MATKRTIAGTWSTTICDGVWTITSYSDETQTSALTERWDTPLPLSALVTSAQREMQAEYEQIWGRKGR